MQKPCVALVRPLFHSLLKLWATVLLTTFASLHLFSYTGPAKNLPEDVERILKKSNEHAYFEKNIGQWSSKFLGLAKISNMKARFYEDKVSLF